MKRPPGISLKQLVDGSLSWRFGFKHGKKLEGGDNYVSQAGFSAMREAVEAMARERTGLGESSFCWAADISFGAHFLQWLDYRAPYWSPKTRDENRRHANRAIVRLGHVPLSKITAEMLDLERNLLLARGKKIGATAAPLSPKTVNETFALVKQHCDRPKNGIESVPIPALTYNLHV